MNNWEKKSSESVKRRLRSGLRCESRRGPKIGGAQTIHILEVYIIREMMNPSLTLTDESRVVQIICAYPVA